MTLPSLLQHLLVRVHNKVRAAGHALQLSPRARLRKCTISITAGDNQLHIDADSDLRRCHITMEGQDNRLIIGQGCHLKGLVIEVLGNHCTLVIGKRVKNTGPGKLSCREAGTRLLIGDDSLLATGITMLTSDGHDIYDASGQRINAANDIVIGRRVWIGQEVMILKGAQIGDDCIIGARATVTGKIAATSIAVGNPAKAIRANITWHERLTFAARGPLPPADPQHDRP